jgi:hypothetical protein
MDSAKGAVYDAILDAGESWKIDKSDKKRLHLKCLLNSCDFRIRVTLSKKSGLPTITKYIPHHCPPDTHHNFKPAHSVRYLVSNHGKTIANDRSLKGKNIVGLEKSVFGHDNLPYLQGWRTHQKVFKVRDGDEEDCFALFPEYIRRFKAVDCDNYAEYFKDPDSKQFKAAFFCPSACKHTSIFARRYYAIDGTHTLSRYRMVLFIAIGIDANNNTFPLAYGLVPIENEFWWTWFLRQLVKACPHIRDGQGDNIGNPVVVINDRCKGLINSVEEVLPLAQPAFCCQHLADNVEKDYGVAARKLFWPCAFATTRDQFNKALVALKAANGRASKYVHDIPHELWAAYAFPVARYGHNTSNIVESINSQWKEIRNLSPLLMMDAIYQWLMKTWFSRKHKVCESLDITPALYKEFKVEQAKAGQYHAIASSRFIFQVEYPNSPIRYIVNLTKKTCSCGDFQEYRRPCKHAIRATQFAGLNPFSPDIFDKIYHTSTYRQMYDKAFYPISIDDIEPDPDMLPPTIQKQSGRPKKQRIRRKQCSKETRPITCDICKQQGHHNKRSCPNAPVASGKAQRRRDRDIDGNNGLTICDGSNDLSISSQDSTREDATIQSSSSFVYDDTPPLRLGEHSLSKLPRFPRRRKDEPFSEFRDRIAAHNALRAATVDKIIESFEVLWRQRWWSSWADVLIREAQYRRQYEGEKRQAPCWWEESQRRVAFIPDAERQRRYHEYERRMERVFPEEDEVDVIVEGPDDESWWWDDDQEVFGSNITPSKLALPPASLLAPPLSPSRSSTPFKRSINQVEQSPEHRRTVRERKKKKVFSPEPRPKPASKRRPKTKAIQKARQMEQVDSSTIIVDHIVISDSESTDYSDSANLNKLAIII